MLRKRIDTLTLGDLRTILDSRLGQGLSAVLVRDLVAATPQAGAVASRPPTRRSRKRSKKSGTDAVRTSTPTKASARKKSAKTKGSSKAKAKAVSKARSSRAKGSVDGAPRVSALTVAGREQYDGALVQYLREHPGYNKPRVIRTAVGGTKLQFRIAMQRLEEKGQVQRQGTHSTTQYAVKP